MTDLTYEIVLYWDRDDQIYVAEVPDLPGCMAHGATRTEAVGAAEAAIEAWIRAAHEDGRPVPAPAAQSIWLT